MPGRQLSELLRDLGVELPVLAAPMAGAPSTPGLVIAAARAGSLGFLAGGYKTASALEGEIETVRAAGVPFAVNLFAPSPLPVDREAYHAYAQRIQGEADRFGVRLEADEPREDDDAWSEKLEVLLTHPVPLVSFTFGIPPRRDLERLRATGALLMQTVTSAIEAQAATAAGVDALAVQSSAAGGHWGTFTPRHPPPALPLLELIGEVSRASELPLLAAGGLSNAAQISQALHAGASAALIGTALLLAEESGTLPAHRSAIAEPGDRETVVTRAFTGRPARGLRNGFIERNEAHAPLGYPAIHHLTAPLRRAASADPEMLNLWAGSGFRAARQVGAADILLSLSC